MHAAAVAVAVGRGHRRPARTAETECEPDRQAWVCLRRVERCVRGRELLRVRGLCRAVGVGGSYSRASAFDSLADVIGHWHLRGYGRWMIADRKTNEPLGVVGLMCPAGWPEPEIAWTVFEKAEGKGIAFEAACFARTYAYEVLGWQTLVSCVLPGNTRSAALAKRMKATQEEDFHHTDLGVLNVFRHLPPEDVT